YSTTNSGNRFDRIPTESFLPNTKYDSSITLPTALMYQNNRGITTFPCACDAASCTNQRPANRNTPREPMSFQGVTVTPYIPSHTLFMATLLPKLRFIWW